jgi:nucleoside-diphosphate-sugar epimerase
MSKLLLITGATGFLGSHLCRALLENGHRVGAFRRPSSDVSRLNTAVERLRWYSLPEDLEAPFSGPSAPDAVIHCAALYGRRGESAAQMMEANTLLPVRLHQLATIHGVPLFLNTDTILAPNLNPYSLSKHQAVEWLKMSGGPTRVLNLKVQHFYGPGDDPTKFVTGLISQCLANVAEIRLTDGLQRRDFVYVADVVGAMLTLLEGGAAKEHFQDYEIGSGQAVSIRELAGRIHTLTGSRSKMLCGALPYRPGEPMLTQANTTALRALGWRPSVSLEEGLRLTIEAQREIPQAG